MQNCMLSTGPTEVAMGLKRSSQVVVVVALLVASFAVTGTVLGGGSLSAQLQRAVR